MNQEMREWLDGMNERIRRIMVNQEAAPRTFTIYGEQLMHTPSGPVMVPFTETITAHPPRFEWANTYSGLDVVLPE